MSDEEFEDLKNKAKMFNEKLGFTDSDAARLESLKDEFDRVVNLEPCSGDPSEEAIAKASLLIDEIIILLMKSGDIREFSKVKIMANTKNFTVKQLSRRYELEMNKDVE